MMERKKKNSSSKSKDECKEMDKIVVNKSEVYHISDDLIMEILLRPPPISVLRCKYVCKTWYSLITNPDFLRTHSSSLQFYKHTTIDYEELMVSSYFSKIIPLKEHPLLLKQGVGVFPNELLDCYLINSCNGLLLLHKSCSSSYYVCNPMIKHYVKIPNITIPKKFKHLEYIKPDPYIMFDPSTSLSYKLIRCLKSIGENNDILCDFYVYSSDIGSWRLLRSFPSSEIGSWRLLITDVLLNGIFYWKELYNGDRLVCFDLMETEPQQQLQDSNLTWSVKYHVNFNIGYVENHPSIFRIIQLYKTKKNEGEEEALLLNICGKIVPFNLKNNTFGKELGIQNPFIFDCASCFSNVCPYITTTLLPLL